VVPAVPFRAFAVIGRGWLTLTLVSLDRIEGLSIDIESDLDQNIDSLVAISHMFFSHIQRDLFPTPHDITSVTKT
jgi:hypothetical protein